MKANINFSKIIVIMSFFFFCISCGASMPKGEEWLNSKTESAEINIAGTWMSPEWGTAKLNQEGKDVTGRLGDYPVKGVVSGNMVYLLMYSGGSVHYTAKLEPLDEKTLKGSYAKYTIIEEKNEHTYIRPMTLIRE